MPDPVLGASWGGSVETLGEEMPYQPFAVQENARLLYYMSGNLQTELKCEARSNYQPKIQVPLKGDGPPPEPPR